MRNRIVTMLLAAILALAMVTSAQPMTVSAAGTYTMSLADASGNHIVEAQPGDTVTLLLKLENNPGIISVGAELAYPQQLTLTKAELNTNDIMTMYTQHKFTPNFTCSQTLSVNPYLVWMNQATGTTERKLVTYNGTIYEFTFQLSDHAQPGNYTVTLTAPRDKNATAGVDGSGVIQPDTNRAITDITTVSAVICVPGKACSHQWSDWTDIPGFTATQEQAGKQIRNCVLCGQQQTRDVPALGQSATETTVPGVPNPTGTNPTETTGPTTTPDVTETDPTQTGTGQTETKPDKNITVHQVFLEGSGSKILPSLLTVLITGVALFFVLRQKKD